MNIHGSDTDARQLPELSPATEKDLEVVREQLGRLPRGVDSIGARCVCGRPTVVVTRPRLSTLRAHRSCVDAPRWKQSM